MTRSLDAALDLLDRHVVDREGSSVGKVDDLELVMPADGSPPRIVALLLGPQAQGPRLGGRLGRWTTAAATAFAGGSGPVRVPVELVGSFGTTIELLVRAEELPGHGRLEAWLRDAVVDRIPGGRRASR